MSDDEKPLGDPISSRFVFCHPDQNDPEIVEQRHRASCLLKLTPKCHTCPNGKFSLFFDTPEKKLEQVMCPKWKSIGDQHKGDKPDEYVVTEVATCKERPFPFCGSCPSKEELQKLEIDKSKDGWLSRWRRFRKEMFEADDDRAE